MYDVDVGHSQTRQVHEDVARELANECERESFELGEFQKVVKTVVCISTCAYVLVDSGISVSWYDPDAVILSIKRILCCFVLRLFLRVASNNPTIYTEQNAWDLAVSGGTYFFFFHFSVRFVTRIIPAHIYTCIYMYTYTYKYHASQRCNESHLSPAGALMCMYMRTYM